MSGSGFDDRRLRDRFLATGEHAPQGTDCPPDDDFFSLCRGELDPARTEALLDHALACARCTEALALAREVVAGMDEPAAPARSRPWTWVGLAAAVLLVAFVTLPRVLDSRDTAPDDGVRDVNTTIELTSPLVAGAGLPRDAFVLRWEGAPDDAIYTVEVVTADLRRVDRAANLTSARYQVPVARLDEIEDGTPLLWSVTAATPDGARYESPAFRVIVQGGS